MRIATVFLLLLAAGCGRERMRPTGPTEGDAGAIAGEAGTNAEAGALADDAAVVPPDSTVPPAAFETFLEDTRLGLVREVWSAGPRDTWLVTATGQVVHWTGGTSPDSWDFGIGLHAVHGTSPTDVWVSGDDGTVASYDASDRSFIPVGDRLTFGPLLDTWGDASTRYVAGELYGDLKYATSPYLDSYTTFEVQDGRGGRLSGDTHCVAGTASGLWVCGEDALYGYDGEWHHIFGGSGSASGGRPFRVAPVGASLALALDERAVTLVSFREVALSGGFGPVSLPIPPGVDAWDGPRLRGVWGDSTEVWVVGTRGYVARMTGYTSFSASWERIDVGTTADLESIYADSESIWIGGDSLVLRRDR